MAQWTKKDFLKHAFKEVFTPQRGRAMAFIGFCILALFLLELAGMIDPAVALLKSDQLTFTFKEKKFTAYHIIRSILLIILILWVAGIVLRLTERRIRAIKGMRPSNRALLVKAIYTLVYFLIFLQALNILGINMTALAVFSGAVGIGVGFGLQKITSNFISGIILLFEKSVEENDLVELADGTTGFVRMTSGRFTLIETGDGKEVMIPNEDFITKQVVNCTHSNTMGRVTIPIAISYDNDIETARELMLEAAEEHPRCSRKQTHSPSCVLDEFGEGSVKLILHFWVDNVRDGKGGPKSDVMRTIWKKFQTGGITFPPPQRNVHIKELPPIEVKG